MDQRISLVTLGVTDLTRARSFYHVRSPEEVGTVLAEAERAGGTVMRPAADATWGGTTGAFADPDGYVWEVAHNPGWTLGEDGAVRI